MPSESTTTNEVGTAQHLVQAGVVRDVHFHGAGAVAEAQRQTIAAQQQLIESSQLQWRAAQLIAVLRFVVAGLAGAVLAEERALAHAQLNRARSEEERARALADAALELVLALGEQGSVALPPELPVITSDEVMLDVRAGLGRVQRILDEQGDVLDRLESSASPALLAARLFEQYVDAPVAVAILSADERFLLVNRQFSQVLGYAAENLAGTRLREIATRWCPDDDGHLVFKKVEWPTGWFRIRRWPVAGCQIAVFEEDWERALPWAFPGSGLPNLDWLKAWFADHGGLDSRQVVSCRVTYDVDAVGTYNRSVELAQRMFHLTSEGRFVVQLKTTTFLFVVDPAVTGLEEFVEGIHPVLEEVGAGVPFTLDGAECGLPRHGFAAEILHNVDTAGRWAAVHGRARPWLVREPVFSGGELGTPSDEPLRFQPFVTGEGNHAWLGVRLITPLSVAVFRRAVEQLVQWKEEESIRLEMQIVVTPEELRLHDWRVEFPRYSRSATHMELVLDREPDFADYTLLRRFSMSCRAGMKSDDEHALRRAYGLGLHGFERHVPIGEPTDVNGVATWVHEYGKERPLRVYEPMTGP